MSIKIMSFVWEHGPARQSDRFVLLALADYANDAGECWPSISGICRKTCMSERGVQTIIRRLQSDGWLDVEVGKGRKNCNIYTLKTPHDMHPAQYAPPHMDAETPHMDAKNPAPHAPEPSLTIKEPSFNNMQIDDAFDYFNAIAHKAGWPKVQKITKARTSSLAARAKECGGYENWMAAMDRAARSDFLSGKATGTTPASFDWLNAPRNFTKLMEGNYDNRDSNNSGSRSGRPGNAMVDAFAQVAAERSARNNGS